MNIAGKFKGALKDLAAAGFNAMPDRFNLFGRYMTGLGNHNLEFDESTTRALRQATEMPEYATVQLTPEQTRQQQADLDRMGAGIEAPGQEFLPMPGPFRPVSGPVNPYGATASSFRPNIAATQTLGRFHADVTPEGVIARDRYDMENENEDPDLVSGKFQPIKALKELRALYDPTGGHMGLTGAVPARQQQYTPGNIRRRGEDFRSATNSPATTLGRSLMYALPIKPKAFDINYNLDR